MSGSGAWKKPNRVDSFVQGSDAFYSPQNVQVNSKY